MLIKILLVVAVVAVIFVVTVALQSPTYSVSRSATINAPPATVFAQVNNFRRWEAWSPWAKIDPAMKQTFEGAPEGKGAIYTWSGDSKAGEGRMEIDQSRPAEFVGINLQFIRPFRADSPTTFAFQPNGNGTNVTWTMTGRKNFLMKAAHLCMNVDKMVGADFEKGLAQMKTVSESAARP